MTMDDLSQKIIEKIAEEKMTPRPRWRFLLWNYAIWALFSLAVIIGSAAVTTIIAVTTKHDWGAYQYLNRSFLSHLAVSLPYLWFIILALFTAAAFYNFKKTRGGYRVSPYLVVLSSILFSILLGGILFIMGFGTEFHEFLSEKVPQYDQLIYTNEDIWSNTERGFLIGRLVASDTKSGNLTVRDFNGQTWDVLLGTSSEIEGTTSLSVGEKLLISGRKAEGTAFLAGEIRPWSGQADDRVRNGQ